MVGTEYHTVWKHIVRILLECLFFYVCIFIFSLSAEYYKKVCRSGENPGFLPAYKAKICWCSEMSHLQGFTLQMCILFNCNSFINYLFIYFIFER